MPNNTNIWAVPLPCSNCNAPVCPNCWRIKPARSSGAEPLPAPEWVRVWNDSRKALNSLLSTVDQRRSWQIWGLSRLCARSPKMPNFDLSFNVYKYLNIILNNTILDNISVRFRHFSPFFGDQITKSGFIQKTGVLFSFIGLVFQQTQILITGHLGQVGVIIGIKEIDIGESLHTSIHHSVEGTLELPIR